MRRRSDRVYLTVTVFILLEAVSVFMVFRSGAVQKNVLVASLRVCSDYVEDRWSKVLYWFSLKDVNRDLMKVNAVLISRNLSLMNHLEQAGLPQDSIADPDRYNLIPAMVISNSVGRLHNYLIIDKGEDDGIRTDMGVITTSGLIGNVVAVSSRYSRIVSMLDTDTRFSVILKRNGTFGTMYWKGTDPTRTVVMDIPVHTPVSEGDTIISSGYSAFFPPGIPIGTISAFSLNDGINYELEVELFEDFRSLKYVYVVDFPDAGEIDGLKIESR